MHTHKKRNLYLFQWRCEILPDLNLTKRSTNWKILFSKTKIFNFTTALSQCLLCISTKTTKQPYFKYIFENISEQKDDVVEKFQSFSFWWEIFIFEFMLHCNESELKFWLSFWNKVENLNIWKKTWNCSSEFFLKQSFNLYILWFIVFTRFLMW